MFQGAHLTIAKACGHRGSDRGSVNRVSAETDTSFGSTISTNWSFLNPPDAHICLFVRADDPVMVEMAKRVENNKGVLLVVKLQCEDPAPPMQVRLYTAAIA